MRRAGKQGYNNRQREKKDEMNIESNEPIVVDQNGKAGRPSKYEPETIDRLLAGLADGLPIKSACIIAGIGVSTLADWREKYPKLEERMTEAREVARQKMLQRIKRAAKDDWRAAVAWLQLTFPADYRRASKTSVEVNTAVQTAVVCDEKRRMELIAQRKRILALSESGAAQTQPDGFLKPSANLDTPLAASAQESDNNHPG